MVVLTNKLYGSCNQKLGVFLMDELMKEISKIVVVPVVVLDEPRKALPIAKALYNGGIGCAEITFRTAAAKEAIKIISKEMPRMIVGAGTVLTVEQVSVAIAAGAKFIVSPGLNPKVVKFCLNNNITVIPGVATPSDIEVALELGLEVVKFFPAEAAGGIDMIKAISAPYTNIKFVPTGGIDIKNLNTYLSFNKVIACGGSWMVNKDLIKKEDYETITKLSRETLSTVLGFEIHHLGINTQTITSADEIACTFNALFGFLKQEHSGSFFAGPCLEVMKKQFLGKNGHIAVRTNNIVRAMYYLQKTGTKFNETTVSHDKNGNIRSIYLQKEIGNFAVHLIQKN
jgi:2-dehydro-3-deoxyphosphogluconate aldolase/(4S)-4-hydroxy-2-oxoglutarate aldolase